MKLRQDRDGWAELDVWDVVSMWLKDPSTNLGLVMQVSTSVGGGGNGQSNGVAGRELRVGVQSQPDSAPFLQLDVRESVVRGEDGRGRRNKRTLSKVCTEERDAAETHCCLWPITIDFELEFGWKWIIHPPKYEANYCAGDCSLGVMMPSNPYSHLLQQVSSSKNSSNSSNNNNNNNNNNNSSSKAPGATSMAFSCLTLFFFSLPRPTATRAAHLRRCPG